jgi:hypothetical protein
MARSWSGRVRAVRCAAVWTALAAALMGALPATAQETGTISGRVLTPRGEGVQGATVAATPAGGGRARQATSGADGSFRVTGLPPGRWQLRATRIGFAPATGEAVVRAAGEARVDLRLADEALVLEAVEVRSRRDEERERIRFETEAGVTTRVITGAEIKMLPGLGEADVMRAIEVLPGVISTSDFSSAFNVRGGSADQNLILLDGFTIFNPFHLGGLFSVFNSDVVARAELLSGGFGARYGGRVSSVLTVETDERPGPVGGAGGVSLLASRLALHGSLPAPVGRALGGDEGSWFLSARRSYFDALLRPVTSFPYHLTDLQAGATLPVRGGGRIKVTAYTGEDVLDLSDFEPPGGDAASVLRLRWNWGNDVLGVRWSQPLGAAWVAETRLGFSRFGESLTFPDFADTRLVSGIQETALRSDFARPLGEALTLQTGGELSRMAYENRADAGGTVFFASEADALFGAAYGEARWRPSAAWLLEPGVRIDVGRSNAGACAAGAQPALVPADPVDPPLRENRTCVLASPRLAAKRFLGAERDAAVKVAAGRYVQWLHSLRDEQLPVSNDSWVLADAYVPPVVSDQLQLGVEKFWGDRWHASVEGYLRHFAGVTDLNPADDPNYVGDDLLRGDGRSYGLDLMLRRSAGPLTGWAALSLLRATRTFPDPTTGGGRAEEMERVTYAPVFDRRADLDVVMQYRTRGGTETGLRWNFGTGTPFTRPVAQAVGFETNVAGGGYRLPRPIGDDPSVPIFVVLGDRNAERYPAYHRLDVTVRREYTRRWGTFTPYAQVLNAYNRRNVLFYFFNYDQTPPTRSGLSMFPLLPSVGVEVAF